MAPRKRKPPVDIPDRTLLYGDVDKESQGSLKEQWRELGKSKSRLPGAIAAAQRGMDTSQNLQYVKKQQHRISSLRQVEPHLQDKPMTLEGATQSRVGLLQAAVKRAREEGRGTVRGAGWYFGHRDEIAHNAAEHGVSVDKAIPATTSLSPQNSPVSEVAGGRAVMDMVAHQDTHTVKMTPELHEAASKVVSRMGGPPIPHHTIDRNVPLSELHHTHIGAIGSVTASMRNAGTPVSSSADFTNTGATMLSDQVAKNVEMLRGQRPPESLIDPRTAAKIHSYNEATSHAVSGTPEHQEYMHRMHHLTSEIPGQTSMDFTGLAHSEEGMLSPRHVTAEDTWMNSISTGQPLARVEGSRGRGIAVAKVAGSDPDLSGTKSLRRTSKSGKTVNVSPVYPSESLGHLMNQEATHRAAESTRIDFGTHTVPTPAIAMQEVPWTEGRIQSGKDPDYQLAHKVDPPSVDRNQGHMFAPSGNVSGVAKLPKANQSGGSLGSIFHDRRGEKQ